MHTPDNLELDLKRVLQALLTDQYLHANDTLQVLEHAAAQPAGHPLEHIAACCLEDRRQPGRLLDVDYLCQWLAGKVGQPYLRIDPMQLDLPQVAGLVSPAFAQRHASSSSPTTPPASPSPAPSPTRTTGRQTWPAAWVGRSAACWPAPHKSASQGSRFTTWPSR